MLSWAGEEGGALFSHIHTIFVLAVTANISSTESYDLSVSDYLGLCKVSVVATDTLCQMSRCPSFPNGCMASPHLKTHLWLPALSQRGAKEPRVADEDLPSEISHWDKVDSVVQALGSAILKHPRARATLTHSKSWFWFWQTLTTLLTGSNASAVKCWITHFELCALFSVLANYITFFMWYNNSLNEFF